MNIQYLKPYNCYLVKKLDGAFYYVNFESNKIIKGSDVADNATRDIPSEYLDVLRDERILVEKACDFYPRGMYRPVRATFLMSTKCNLDCVYCYAYNDFSKDLSFSSARIVVDYLINNAIERKKECITIRFHGLGEPTQNLSVIKEVVEYVNFKCSKSNLKAYFYITTNGIMLDDQRDFIIGNIDYITLSMDGLEKYHNLQRPLRSGNSFSEALKTLLAIPNKERCLIRTTVTNNNLSDLDNWCGFLQSYGIKKVSLEPVSVCGNCVNTNTTNIDNKEFCAKYFELCKKYADLQILYSCFQRCNRPYHCGAYGSNMVVTPFDTISTCYECYDDKVDEQKLFIIGKIENEKIYIDENKFRLLRNQCCKLRKECLTCFAQTFCNGSCLSKRYKSYVKNKNSYKIVENKCLITKKIILDKLDERLCSDISSTHSEELFE